MPNPKLNVDNIPGLGSVAGMEEQDVQCQSPEGQLVSCYQPQSIIYRSMVDVWGIRICLQPDET